jgi:SPP1 gp7 family putative phage head morphogenesis protein
MLRDRAKYVNPGVPVAALSTLRLMQRVINGYGRGERWFRHIIEKHLADFARSLGDGMATAYLMGARRAIIHSGLKLQQQNEYDETLRFLQTRLALDAAELAEVQEFYRAPALRVVNDVADNVDRALQRTMARITEQGLHVRQGKARLALAFDKLGISNKVKHRGTLEAIYRTQTQLAYSAGQWAYNQQPEIQEILWGYKYSAVGDERTREEHALLDGTTLPKDDPRWASIFPPNGWNCRCVAIEIYRKVKVQAPPPPKEVNGKVIVPGPDKGFDFNPGEALDAIGQQQMIKRAMARA